MSKKTLLIAGIIVFVAAFLRLYKINSLPPSPYWEEVAIGYDAYSVALTGRDHHGHSWPVVAFESFGDWKPALYFYTVMPLVKLFGLQVWSVRLPAALSGILIVVGVGLLAAEIESRRKKRLATPETMGLVAMAVTAISPWAIIFSRAGWEVNLATALILWGVVVFLRKGRWVILSAVLLALSMYAYHAARVIAPLLGVGLAFWWFLSSHQKRWREMMTAAAVAVIIALPLLTSLSSNSTTQRFRETSIFADLGVIEQSNALRERADNTLLARLIYHRYVLYGREIIINMLDHFNGNFLFMTGDVNPRHSVQYVGQLYHVEFIFLLLGGYYLLRTWRKEDWLLSWWLVIGLIPAALTKTTPHALRVLPVLPIVMYLISTGIVQLIKLFNGHRWMKISAGVAVVSIYLIEGLMFWRFYTTIYPVRYGQEWQYGYQQMIELVNRYQQEYPELPVYITREQGRPAMYYWFFSRTDPRQVQAADAAVAHDQSEALEYANIMFIDNISQIDVGRALVAASPEFIEQLKGSYSVDLQTTVSGLQDQVIWNVAILEQGDTNE